MENAIVAGIFFCPTLLPNYIFDQILSIFTDLNDQPVVIIQDTSISAKGSIKGG